MARRVLALRHFDKRVREAMEPRLRGERVAVGRERALLDHDAVPALGRPVEGDQQEVQVDRQRIHHHHFVRPRAGQARDRRSEQLMVGQPWALALVVALDRAPAPGIQLRQHVLPRAPRHEAQRVPREVQLNPFREDELVAEPRQRIGGVLRARPGRVVAEFRHARSSSLASRPSHSSALAASNASRVRESSSSERISAPGRSSPSGKG